MISGAFTLRGHQVVIQMIRLSKETGSVFWISLQTFQKHKCSADVSQELTDGQMTQYTCSVFHIALYSPLKRQKRSGLRPGRCHRSTLIAFGLSVRTGRTHLKYTHTETLCTCTYVNEYVYVCVPQHCRKHSTSCLWVKE